MKLFIYDLMNSKSPLLEPPANILHLDSRVVMDQSEDRTHGGRKGVGRRLFSPNSDTIMH